jgi:hypothetical protein
MEAFTFIQVCVDSSQSVLEHHMYNTMCICIQWNPEPSIPDTLGTAQSAAIPPPHVDSYMHVREVGCILCTCM